jgi:transposase-like protein
MPISLRGDYDAAMVRATAKRSKDGRQVRRLLALAAIYEGARRTEAAKIGGVRLQIVRDWVLKFNAHGPQGPRSQGSGTTVAAERRTPRRARRAHRERSNPGGSWGRAMADRRSLSMDIRGIPRGRRQADVEPGVARNGLSQALGPPPPSCSGHGRDRTF